MVFIELIAGFSAQIPTRQQNILVTRRELVTGELKFLGILSGSFLFDCFVNDNSVQ